MSDVAKMIEAVWKAESTRLIAAIARVTLDIGIAEELAQDVLVAALERWPEEGVPENPAAWLMTAAKRRALDSLRRQMLVQKHEEIARELEVQLRRPPHQPSGSRSDDRLAARRLGVRRAWRRVPKCNPSQAKIVTHKTGALFVDLRSRLFLI